MNRRKQTGLTARPRETRIQTPAPHVTYSNPRQESKYTGFKPKIDSPFRHNKCDTRGRVRMHCLRRQAQAAAFVWLETQRLRLKTEIQGHRGLQHPCVADHCHGHCCSRRFLMSDLVSDRGDCEGAVFAMHGIGWRLARSKGL